MREILPPVSWLLPTHSEEKKTTGVMDKSTLPADTRKMTKHATFHEWLEELRAEILARPRGTKARLVSQLGMSATAVTRISNGDVGCPSSATMDVSRALNLPPPPHLFSPEEWQLIVCLREVQKHAGEPMGRAFVATAIGLSESLIEAHHSVRRVAQEGVE